MIKITIDYNKGFNIPPENEIQVIDEYYVNTVEEAGELINELVQDTDTTVYNVKFDYDAEMPVDTENAEG